MHFQNIIRSDPIKTLDANFIIEKKNVLGEPALS